MQEPMLRCWSTNVDFTDTRRIAQVVFIHGKNRTQTRIQIRLSSGIRLIVFRTVRVFIIHDSVYKAVKRMTVFHPEKSHFLMTRTNREEYTIL